MPNTNDKNGKTIENLIDKHNLIVLNDGTNGFRCHHSANTHIDLSITSTN